MAQVEDTVVLPAWARHGSVDHPAIIQMLTEHIDLRRRAADLAADETPAPAVHEPPAPYFICMNVERAARATVTT